MGDGDKVVEGEYDIQRIKRELCEIVVIPTVVYNSETWSLIAYLRRKIEVFEMMCLRNICGNKESGQSEKRNYKRGAGVS